MTSDEMKSELRQFAQRQLKEVILPFWTNNIVDEQQGGFIGQIDHYGHKKPDKPKGIILNARILWTFSALYKALKDPFYLHLSKRAYNFLEEYFHDHLHGGYFWSVNPDGSINNGKKQIYAQAFVIYSLAEYAGSAECEEALKTALNIFRLIEEKSFDTKRNGYFEAFSRSWEDIGDLRLSDLDMNEKKTMNTHLHIIEAYARLYSIQQDSDLKDRIQNILHIFQDQIYQEDHHLGLFFDEDWDLKSDDISYGHDIEASWLLYESAQGTGNKLEIGRMADIAVRAAEAVLPAINNGGGLIHEGSRNKQHVSGELEWWAQAEAIVGFINAYEISGDEDWLFRALNVSRYIDKYFTDHVNGEWYYRVDAGGTPVPTYEKAGFWKCPYHNSRMCLEVLRRLN